MATMDDKLAHIPPITTGIHTLIGACDKNFGILVLANVGFVGVWSECLYGFGMANWTYWSTSQSLNCT